MKWALRIVVLALALAALGGAWLWHVNFNDGVVVDATPQAAAADPLQIERGAYLARIGNCLACHTARGGVPAAGGLPIPTEFGTVYSSNLTPDPATGIGAWTANTFWRAVHFGRSADGRLLVPVFPYTHSTLMRRDDVDALFAYFRSLPPTSTTVPAHELRWPYGTQLALAFWRALYFRPGSYVDEPQRDPRWNRGAYLAHAVAHCSACHAPRDSLGGGDWSSLRGGLVKGQGWYAPSLLDPREAGLGDWSLAEIGELLRAGVTEPGRASGPMAETVMRGTQYLSDPDTDALATYLKGLPQEAPSPAAAMEPVIQATPSYLEAGQKLYEKNCAQCHGMQGEGVARALAYPPLAGNRAVTLPSVDNLLQIVLNGGFNAVTQRYPRPFGMPPFALKLTDAEIASVLSYIRTAWGNEAGAVSALAVHTHRALTAAAATGS